ncbi:uncharacterized protein LOC142897162 isoform X2 [Nelusetta ayraudi]|uniref:uncharacterized protein LOC142897162 isoform X2 n=1 Tax=Nelusetta ayraudi TaxID=303726 RepID=UPI003F6F5463
MARNEEKQQGRLNRLWLQREREEGRLKDALERRPKLSTLNSASSVKKWIPSIQKEIEYCLQSQLTHYPERKIAEFQLQIEALEKEYKRFVAKLRVLDPSCKHKPWTPRSYSKRRADTQDPTGVAKVPRPCESNSAEPQPSGGKSDFSSRWTESHSTEPLCLSHSSFQTPLSTDHVSAPLSVTCVDQDQPLSFDNTRLAVATAAFRGSLAKCASSEVQNLASVLQSKLPNLTNSSSEQTLPDQSKSRDAEDCKSDCEAAQRTPGEPSAAVPTERTAHVLGLDYNSSSDDE